MQTCQIVMQSLPDPLREGTFHHVPVRVEGDLRNPVAVSYCCLNYLSLKGDNFPQKIGMMGLDWRLLEVRQIYGDALYMCITPWPFRWMFHKAAMTARNGWRWFTMRVILTLHVWGLAFVPAGEKPSWQHVGKDQIRKVKQLWQASQTGRTATRIRQLRDSLPARWRRVLRRR